MLGRWLDLKSRFRVSSIHVSWKLKLEDAVVRDSTVI